MLRQAQAGYVTGGRVFGYDNERDIAGVRRVINESEAAVVRRIFELCARGYRARRPLTLLSVVSQSIITEKGEVMWPARPSDERATPLHTPCSAIPVARSRREWTFGP
jgi:hypothetical protein